MKAFRSTLFRAGAFFFIFTVLCGIIYPLAVTGVAQLLFPKQANGSMVEADGKYYGSELLAQQYTGKGHLWGRVMELDTATFTDENGKPVMYAAPSNLSPASTEYGRLVAQRTEIIKAAHPDRQSVPVPVDLVTGSGSGLDPHISVAAGWYQAGRIATNTGRTEAQVLEIIKRYTTGRFLGIFGEPTVNVLQVNLALDGIL